MWLPAQSPSRKLGLDGWAHSTPFEVPDSANEWMAANDRFVIATANVGEKLAGLRVLEDTKQSFFDNLIVKGNPAENISDSRNVRHVFLQGKQIDLQSLTR